MTPILHQQRVEMLYRMLLELANGNLAFRIAPEGTDAAFDELATLANELALKMHEAGYIHPYYSKVMTETGTDYPSATLMQKVQCYILDHLDEPLPSAKKISELFGINETLLKSKFRKHLNTTLYQYYTDERLHKAHRLIRQTAYPLNDIAFICGFNDYTNFYKAFRKKYGCTPRSLNRMEHPE